jgi:hypothetical protein
VIPSSKPGFCKRLSQAPALRILVSEAKTIARTRRLALREDFHIEKDMAKKMSK